MSDIIDNRNVKLVDQINTILDSTDAARFAVGYFFLSGFTAIAKHLNTLREMRLLIGSTSSRETIEQLAEGYRRLELVAETIEAQHYRKKNEAQSQAQDTVQNLRSAIALMDQTDESQFLVKSLVRMIEEKRLKVRIYTRGRLHAKAYIFDYGAVYDQKGRPIQRQEQGIAIVGSSNLSLSGITHNTELNVVVHGNDNHADLVTWFDELWNEAEDFDTLLMEEMRESWAYAPVRPYDIYMKTLYTLVKDRIESTDEHDILWDDDIIRDLADFQKVAVRQAVQMIRDYGGAFVSDVVGLGKSYIGAAIVKHFERTRHARPLIICPAPLVEMWERYNERYQLNARVLSLGMLREDDASAARRLLDNPLYRDRDFVLIDESHNLRHRDTQRYRVLQAFMATGGRQCCLLTATPRNKSAWDVYHQLKLFHTEEKTDLPIDPPELNRFFRLIEVGQRKLPDILTSILVRRTRTHIVRWYGYDEETNEPINPAEFQDYMNGEKRAYVYVNGRRQFFPRRRLETIEYSIEDTYQGLYQDIRRLLGRPRGQAGEGELTYARYGLWNYVRPQKQGQEPYISLQRAGANLGGLIRILLFKRFESSVYAFQETLKRLINVHQLFLQALEQGIVSAGKEAQRLLYESYYLEEEDLIEALEAVTGQYRIEDFDVDRLRADIQHDIDLFEEIRSLVDPITPEQDAKLQRLLSGMQELEGHKVLIFTQYADTARYLYDNLNPDSWRQDIDVIYSGDKSKARAVGRFAPNANQEYRLSAGEEELSTLIATDVLAEGLNLQDCNIIINYDLHWNPVRLIQRFGRIDRIGTEHDQIFGYNFLPEIGIERELGLRQKLENRIREIHDTIGEDAAILDPSEQLNPEAMYAIYENDGNRLSDFEIEDGAELLDLNEAEEMMRQLRKDDPEEYDRITNLRDGIRTSKQTEESGLFVFCQAGRYQQLFLVDGGGNIITRDIPHILGAIRSVPTERGLALPNGYNQAVMKIKQMFAEEAKHRQAERQHSLSLTTGQKYVLRELGVLFKSTDDEDLKGQINILEKAFRGKITTAVNRELNMLRRNGVLGQQLLKMLANIYLQHNMRDWLDSNAFQDEQPVAKIICSEALI